MPTAVEPLVRDAELLVVDGARETPGGRGEPVLPGLRDALTDHGRIARRMQERV